MTHFGILSLPLTGHLNPILSLASELKNRGHLVTVFGIPDIEEKVKISNNFNFYPIGRKKYPPGSLKQITAKQGELTGFAGVKNIFQICGKMAELNFEEAIPAIKDLNIDILIIDQSLIEGAMLASFLNLPFITVCGCILIYPDPNLPSIFTSYKYEKSFLASCRNFLVNIYIIIIGIPLIRLLQNLRKRYQIEQLKQKSLWSEIAVICQQPRDFEFPRSLPDNYHYVGPLISGQVRDKIDFPWEKINNDKLLVYASLGTLQTQLISVYKIIANVCSELDVQLVLSLGGSLSPKDFEEFSGSQIIVKYAPQLELLKKATLCITHGGLNTTMECLMNGVPMVAIPITNDQPGVASRIKWTGTGEFVPLKNLNRKKLKILISKVLKDPQYKLNAIKLQKAIEKSGGVQKAADIIEVKISNL